MAPQEAAEVHHLLRSINGEGEEVFIAWLWAQDRAFLNIQGARGQAKTTAQLDVILLSPFNLLSTLFSMAEH